MARKRKRYLEEESEKEDKSHGLQSEKVAETKQQVEKEGQDDEKKDCTKEPLKNGEAQVVVKQEPADKRPKNEKVTLSCNALYEMAQKREIIFERRKHGKRGIKRKHTIYGRRPWWLGRKKRDRRGRIFKPRGRTTRRQKKTTRYSQLGQG